MISIRSWIIALPCLAVATLTAIVVIASKSDPPVQISIVNAAELETKKLMTVDFRRCDPRARFAETHRVELRVGGRWQPPVSLPEFEDGYLFQRTNYQRLAFAFPREIEACRFLLSYRVGPSPYCQAYFFLGRHGLSQRFPKLSRAFLKRVPQQPRLRRVE